MYTPQPIAVHTNLARQNFRRGDCSPYDNVVRYTAPNFIMPNVFIARLTVGGTATVEVFDLDDNSLTTLTPASQTIYALDDEGEWEMLVLGAGNWAGAVSLMAERRCYLAIDDGSTTYYTDEIQIDTNTSGFPPDCGENWIKVSWVLNGSCMVSGKTSANEAEPIHPYPLTDLTSYIFWKANVSRPEWEFEEKVEPDAHGVNVPETKRLVKRWSAEGVPVSESVSDALTVAALSDAVTIEFRDGTAFTGIMDIQTDVAWEAGGCKAVVKFNFSTNYLVKQGCC